MSQIIKFRVWDKRLTKGSSTKEMLYNAENHHLWNDFINYPESYILTQFTGLKDKNNKDIYEGDIIKVSELNNNQQAGPGKRQILQTFDKAIVTFSNGCYYYNPIRSKGHNIPHGFLYYGYEKEVIGNIFENPDLL